MSASAPASPPVGGHDPSSNRRLVVIYLALVAAAILLGFLGQRTDTGVQLEVGGTTIPLAFVLFALVLVGVAFFHHHTLAVALSGVVVLTATKLVVVHADDHDDHHERAVATATSESIPLAAVRGVMLAHVVANPDAYVPGSLGREITLTLGWGAVSRLDVMPASCGDPQCEADHGFEGTLAADDISLRISADADGDAALARALHFASALSATIGR